MVLSVVQQTALVQSTVDRAHHRLHRVLSFFSSRPNWDSPPPHTQAIVYPPPPGSGGATPLRERGGGSQFPRGDRHCGSLDIYVFSGAHRRSKRGIVVKPFSTARWAYFLCTILYILYTVSFAAPQVSLFLSMLGSNPGL
jgi:hypothetical protein